MCCAGAARPLKTKDSIVDRLDVNPYESPRSVANESSVNAVSAIFRSIVRVLMLGLVGYASFAGFGLLYWAMSGEDGQATIQWALSIGMFGGLTFPCSEVFNAGPGRAGGVVRRVLVALGVVLASLFLSGILAEMLGWMEGITYTSDPFALHRDILAAVVFVLALFTTRVVWMTAPPQSRH